MLTKDFCSFRMCCIVIFVTTSYCDTEVVVTYFWIYEISDVNSYTSILLIINIFKLRLGKFFLKHCDLWHGVTVYYLFLRGAIHLTEKYTKTHYNHSAMVVRLKVLRPSKTSVRTKTGENIRSIRARHPECTEKRNKWENIWWKWTGQLWKY